MGFAVNVTNRSNSSSFQQRGKDVTCTHCGKYGHAQNDCFQKNGYPEWWRGRGRDFGDRGRDFSERGRGGGLHGRFGRGGRATRRFGRGIGVYGRANTSHVQSGPSTQSNDVHKMGDYDRQSQPQLSDDQWTSLLSFISSQKAEPTEKLNGKTKYGEFIIDMGASHHMTWRIDYLCNVTDIVPCMIGLPDGDSVVAIKQGDLCLGGDLWLRGVLYSHELTFSLISVVKFLKIIKGSITFTDELCVLQDRTSKKLTGAGESAGVYIFRGVIGEKLTRQ